MCLLDLTSTFVVSGMALAWQQMTAILIKRFHHSRRDWKGLIAQIVLPVVFVLFAMALSCIKNDLQHYPELKLSPELYNLGPSYSFFRSVFYRRETTATTTNKKQPNEGFIFTFSPMGMYRYHSLCLCTTVYTLLLWRHQYVTLSNKPTTPQLFNLLCKGERPTRCS